MSICNNCWLFAGNFFRIRSAFKYGARKLGWIPSLPGERIADELKKFFANTLDMHGSNCWTDMQNSSLGSDVVSENLSSSSCLETSSEENNFVDSTVSFNIQGFEAASGPGHKLGRHVLKTLSPHLVTECSFDGDVKEHESGILGTRNTNGPTDFPVDRHLSASVSLCSNQSPFFPSGSCGEGQIETLHFGEKPAANSAIDGMNVNSKLEHKGNHVVTQNLASSCINCEDREFIGSACVSDVTRVSENTDHVEITRITGSTKNLEFLLDLSGDYDNQIRSLQYGRLCHGNAMSPPSLPSPPLSPQLSNKNSWEAIHKSLQFQQNVSSRSNGNCIALGTQFYPANHSSLPNVVFGEKSTRPRGTGTYIPNVVIFNIYKINIFGLQFHKYFNSLGLLSYALSCLLTNHLHVHSSVLFKFYC